jgi:NAD(P)-dependent dehydrogenase (short-subunit alcohol dehydrogenase family)
MSAGPANHERVGRLAGKVALVTGASRGLGRSIAERFAQEGAAVAAVARTSRAAVEEIAHGINAAGGRAVALIGDVGDRADARRLVAEAVTAFGCLDILVNNAGIDVTSFRPLHEFDEDTWDDILRTNLTGAFLMTKYAVPALLDSGRASIVNIASVCGVQAWKGDAPYNSSKAAMIMLTQTAALDYARQGIRCNAVCPAVIGTDMTWEFIKAAEDPNVMEEFFRNLPPMHALGVPVDVANAALYLASDEAGFVTGAVLTVDGGMTAHGA